MELTPDTDAQERERRAVKLMLQLDALDEVCRPPDALGDTESKEAEFARKSFHARCAVLGLGEEE